MERESRRELCGGSSGPFSAVITQPKPKYIRKLDKREIQKSYRLIPTPVLFKPVKLHFRVSLTCFLYLS